MTFQRYYLRYLLKKKKKKKKKTVYICFLEYCFLPFEHYFMPVIPMAKLAEQNTLFDKFSD
jgi:hypothetical protein